MSYDIGTLKRGPTQYLITLTYDPQFSNNDLRRLNLREISVQQTSN